MSIIKRKFYHHFWNNPACQNLFLLSKEELLETKSFGTDPNRLIYSTNRIIVSNVDNIQDPTLGTIRSRNENHNIDLDSLIKERLEDLKPVIENFFDSKFKKAFDKFSSDLDKKGVQLVFKVAGILMKEDKRESKIINLLQHYGFIGKHINSFKEIGNDFERMFLPDKKSNLINENTIRTFFEGIKFIKELYVNHSHENLYNTNQVLTNILNSEDNFESRIKLFGDLYDSGIISHSKDDAFIECIECDSHTYKGVFQLRLNPKKLKELKCPSCSNELKYFVPYELHNDIFESIKSNDGLILDALAEKLTSNGIKYEINKKFLNDIEIDCIFKSDKKVYLVETKMYKQNTTEEKLIKKMKEHFSKLIKDLERIEESGIYRGNELNSILVVNVNNINVLSSVRYHFNNIAINKKEKVGEIVNLNYLKFDNRSVDIDNKQEVRLII